MWIAQLVIGLCVAIGSPAGELRVTTAYNVGDNVYMLVAIPQISVTTCELCGGIIRSESMRWTCAAAPTAVVEVRVRVNVSGATISYLLAGSNVCHEDNLAKTRASGRAECRQRNGLPKQPVIIPWIEVNQPYGDPARNEAQIVNCVAGVEYWRQVTDVVLVSTNTGHEELYTELRQRMPRVRIIPGLKTNDTLGGGNFDSPECWQELALSIASVMESSGQTVVALEHESALGGYWRGEYDIDFDQLRKGLSCLPKDVQILWYPTLLANDAQRRRCIPLMKTVQAVLNCRLIDLTVCDPWRNNTKAKQALAALAAHDPLPIMYVGRMGQYSYWPYTRIDDMLKLTKVRPEVLIYPGATNWELAAQEISAQLLQE